MMRLVRTPRFHLILQSEFPINALILATEALRIANQNSGRKLFEWELVSLDGEDVRASNGMWLTVDLSLPEVIATDYCLVFEGNLPTQNNSPLLTSKLRELYRQGATLVGIDTGAFALTQAGVINDSVVVHWEASSTYQERFSRLPLGDNLYQIDGSIISCAGGVATLDLMLEIIKRHYEESLSIEVANALIHAKRDGRQAQRAETPHLNESRSFSDRLVSLLEKHLDFPLTAAEIAGRLSISLSTLERHCHRHFSRSPMQLYLGLRLQGARNYLFYEDSSIKEAAIAFGFSSPGVFSRTFKHYFGQTPRAFRQSIREKQAGTRLPEISRLYAERSKADAAEMGELVNNPRY